MKKKIIMLAIIGLSAFKGLSMEPGNKRRCPSFTPRRQHILVGYEDISFTSEGFNIGKFLLNCEPLRLPSSVLQLTSNDLSLNAVQAKLDETKKNNPPEKGVFESPIDRHSQLTPNDQSFNDVQAQFNELKNNSQEEVIFMHHHVGNFLTSGEDENIDDLGGTVIDVPLCSSDDLLTSERTPSALSVREKDIKSSPTEGAVDSSDLSSDSGEKTNSQEINLNGIIWKVEEVSSRIWS